MSKQCPFCPPENGQAESWGMSLEGSEGVKWPKDWMERMREHHYKFHCIQCPLCGQYTQKDKLNEFEWNERKTFVRLLKEILERGDLEGGIRNLIKLYGQN
jgi:hypothetical protein